ncbi:toll/interleukin-1 receptor domain-containing protein [Dactylosporangium sp. NPDC005572]|uniref:toll/interleukin-1 receptor domain-containing protein n=1 Tax=Dactylosporangium sp. NPDC005572 TaxID=3156889 RepID=UPI0033B0B21E
MSTGPLPDPDLFFFLSFAETSKAENDLVRDFFGRLRDEVRAQAGLGMNHPARTGFLSIVSLGLGYNWSYELREALGTCGVFVALTAPTYFNSGSCGKEWQAFADREAKDRRETGRQTMAPVLLPVRWRESPMPPVADEIQYVDRSLSDVVHELGLHAVAKSSALRDDYDAFVARLAGLIVRRARAHRLPSLVPGLAFDKLPQAFPPDRSSELNIPPQAGPPPAEPSSPPQPPKRPSDFPYFSV